MMCFTRFQARLPAPGKRLRQYLRLRPPSCAMDEHGLHGIRPLRRLPLVHALQQEVRLPLQYGKEISLRSYGITIATAIMERAKTLL